MISGLNHITLAVKDIDDSFAFYHDVLGFKPLVKWNNGAYFLVNDNLWFCLNVDENRTSSPCYTHYAFSVNQEHFDTMSNRIIQSGATIFKENSSPGASLYFLDPDAHKLEIHVGDWQSRVAAKRGNAGSWQNIEWFV